jgi:papain like protease
MRSRAAGAIGFVLWLGACEVHIGSPPAPSPAPPPPPVTLPPRPAPPAAQPPSVSAAPPAAQPPSASPAPPAAGQPAAAPRLVVLRFPSRIVHPPPLQNAGGAQLNVQALKLRLRVSRKCGPREVPPNSGHWIHLDCNPHLALTRAKAYSPRKIRIMLAGGLKLDTAVGQVGRPVALDRATEAALPDAVDHRNDGTEGPIEDQGQVGACTAFSLASAMDNGIRRQSKPDTMSPMHLWSHYGVSVLQAAGDDNLGKPIANWDVWQYDERIACELDRNVEIDPTDVADCGPYKDPVIPGSARADAQLQAKIRDSDSKGHWKVTEYDEIAPADPDTIAAMLASGADVWFTMRVGTTWLNPSGDTVADWTDEQIDGGHAVLFAGYRHKSGQRQFLVHNSWGKDWADHGFGYISEAMVRKYIKHAYKVVVSDSSQPPPPSASDALTDDDCGEDQLVDSVTGQCATICPDDSRPAGGQCDAAAGARKPGAAPPRGMRIPVKH